MKERVRLPGRSRILHVHSSFEESDATLRTVRLVRAFGNAARHAVVAAEPARTPTAERIVAQLDADLPSFPPLSGFPMPGRLKRIAAAMQGYDLICTYGLGAMDATLAHTLFADVYSLAPLIHHEDALDAKEARRLKTRRNFYRRIALGRTAALVVPSQQLQSIALDVWQQPRSRVQRIPNGAPVGNFAKKPKRDVLPRLVKHKDEHWIGTLGALDDIKNLPALVRIAGNLPEDWHCVIFGEGPERQAIEAEAERLGIEHRVHLPGTAEPERVLGLLDIFVLTSRSEQFPISVIEAMAAGLPVAAPAVGDIAATVAEENEPYVTIPGDEPALSEAVARLSANPAGREAIGRANREKARADYDEAKMVARYKALYWGVMGRKRG